MSLITHSQCSYRDLSFWPLCRLTNTCIPQGHLVTRRLKSTESKRCVSGEWQCSCCAKWSASLVAMNLRRPRSWIKAEKCRMRDKTASLLTNQQLGPAGQLWERHGVRRALCKPPACGCAHVLALCVCAHTATHT